jgi:hypothetical protein
MAEPLSFFTVDRGTASTAVALVAPLDGRFRLLASDVSPRGVPLDVLLEDLVARVVATEPDALPDPNSWPDWARLESATHEPLVMVCAAPNETRLADLERAVAGAGWEIRAHAVAGRSDMAAIADACLDPAVSAIAVCGSEPAAPEDRGPMTALAAMLGSIASRRPEVSVLLAGNAVAHARAFPEAQIVQAPSVESVPAPVETPFRHAVLELAARIRGHASGGPGAQAVQDGREAVRVSAGTLARLLDRRIEAVDVGYAQGSRTLAHPDGRVWHITSADGALVPASALLDDREVDQILRWSALRADPFTLVDRVRNLRLAPWREAGGDGAKLRLAALRAALARLHAAWRTPPPTASERQDRSSDGPGDLLIGCGGAFSALPAPAAALALVDTLRRPGAMAVFHDHARLLGPVGTLPDESDRRRLLADLIDDALLPLGSAVITGEVRPSRHPGRLRVTSSLRQSELELSAGALRLLDLPPGVAAHVEIEARDGTLMGLRSRHVALEVTGGLGGLLVDTREIPLRLPERAERRRALFESWERPIWASVQS